MKSTVYFSRTITPDAVLRLYKLVGKELPGKVAVKVHSGEKGNQNFLHPDFWKEIIDYVGGTVVECNTAYEGARNTTPKHLALLEDHGWNRYFTVDLLDAHADRVLQREREQRRSGPIAEAILREIGVVAAKIG